MFIGALNPTPEVAARLQEWADALWPDHLALDVDSRCRFWQTAERGILGRYQAQTERHRTVVSGWIWDESSSGAGSSSGDDVEWGALDRLGDLLLDDGWPLPRSWDGSFSCAAYDRQTGVLSLAVDPIGLHRLFYAQIGETVVFGNVQSACARAAGLEPNLVRLAQWLGAGDVVGRETLFRGLYEIQIGERRRFRADGSELDTASDVPWHQHMESVSPEVGAERIVPWLKRYADRFADRYRPERVALALSGGMDSRLVLGALGNRATGLRTYTYGAADDHEVALAMGSARVMGAQPALVDLVGRFFPDEQEIRRRALLSEAIAFPQWHHVDAAAEQDGVDTLLLGDITNCLNVYIKPLRGRKERLQQRIDLLMGRSPGMDENPTSVEAWLEEKIAYATRGAGTMAERLRLDVDADEIRRAVGEDYRQTADHLHVEGHSLFCLQEKFYLAVERQASGGSQIVSLDGTREVIPIFSARKIVEMGFNVGFTSRTRRGLIDAVARKLLPKEIRRLPTATIPWVSVSAPKWGQEAAWLGRWLADAGYRKLYRRFPKVWPRDRLFKTLSLQPEYQEAVRRGYGEPWGVSGVASTEYWARRIARTASGDRPTTVPISEMRALAADTMIAASIHGPEVLDRLDELPRT